MNNCVLIEHNIPIILRLQCPWCFIPTLVHTMLEDVPRWIVVSLVSVAQNPGMIAILTVLAIVYYFISRPLNIVKDLSAIGYDCGIESGQAGRWKKQSKGDIARELSKLMRVGKLPPVVPNGWFGLIESDQLKKGQVKNVAALGENFAVFRGESGEVHVLDAYCPHLGANMAVGGTVRGDTLECPFHAWSFRGCDGQCTSVPYSDKVPEFARVKRWQSCEVNSFVFVWYHAEGAEPDWRPQQLPQLTKGPKQWSYRGRNEFYISAHIQEIPENGADVAHFNAIHGPALTSGGDLRSAGNLLAGGSWARHVWQASWQALTAPGQSHRALMNLQHELRLFNKIPLMTMNVEAHQIGPGYVELKTDTSFGQAVFLQTVTPVAPLLQRVTHRLYTTPYMPAIFSNIMILGEAIMFERDVMVWNHKKFEEKPLLVAEDRAILKYRRWYSQFYSDNSPRLGDRNSSTLEW